MKKQKSIFQSYLILGDQDYQESSTNKIAAKFDIQISKNSPDINVIEPPEKLQHISIELVRELKRVAHQKPLLFKKKLIIIKKADKLTHEAQNALLKVLEEPPESTIIILQAKDRSNLLPTVLSRLITIQDKDQNRKSTTLFSPTLKTAHLLEEIPQIDNPINWLDEQISALHTSLVNSVYSNKPAQAAKISDSVQKFAEAKKMIEANVNPNFVLFNLALQL